MSWMYEKVEKQRTKSQKCALTFPSEGVAMSTEGRCLESPMRTRSSRIEASTERLMLEAQPLLREDNNSVCYTLVCDTLVSYSLAPGTSVPMNQSSIPLCTLLHIWRFNTLSSLRPPLTESMMTRFGRVNLFRGDVAAVRPNY